MKRRPALINNPQMITTTPYNCIDSGGFYITCFRREVLKAMDKDKLTISHDVVSAVTKAINGSDNGLVERKFVSKIAAGYLLDEI